jgi:hypothetical protein
MNANIYGIGKGLHPESRVGLETNASCGFSTSRRNSGGENPNMSFHW